jgi:hypothetical protein
MGFHHGAGPEYTLTTEVPSSQRKTQIVTGMTYYRISWSTSLGDLSSTTMRRIKVVSPHRFCPAQVFEVLWTPRALPWAGI